MGLFRNQITEQTFQLSFEQLNRNELFKNSFIKLAFERRFYDHVKTRLSCNPYNLRIVLIIAVE